MGEYKLKPVVPQQPQVTEKKPEKINPSVPVETGEPIDKTGDPPYPVEYLGIDEWGHYLADPRLDINGVKDKVVYIEQFVKAHCGDLGLKQDTETYRSILNQIEKKLSITSFHESDLRLDKIFSFLKTLKKQTDSRQKMRKMIQKAQEEAEKARLRKQTDFR